MAKFLTLQETRKFIDWCKESKISQKKIAEICHFHEQWVSKVFTSHKVKRNKNCKKEKEPLLFDRIKAEKLVETLREQANSKFKTVDFL
jgi:hypothetical protein